MSRLRITIIAIVASMSAVSCTGGGKLTDSNRNYMWFDCEANYATLSHPDSIRFYLEKCRDLGFNNAVVDVKSIMGEVLYDSKIAPYMGEWEGVERSRDYDMMGYFIKYGHELGMKVSLRSTFLPADTTTSTGESSIRIRLPGNQSVMKKGNLSRFLQSRQTTTEC